ncbi:NADP-dependent malic enzyme [Geothrix alkalitolerans]|uniref:NADP-dependent malic enzyme n=1 Tax=Geothrix alkalitolerans TaxID=2922724 RepID=UPI001FAF1D4C|nr:NADP-dependent malic enzyme [Geothrix alkalitolerans]
MKRKQEALDYHSQGRKGKIEVIATKPCSTARDLSLAYSPGVAEPCLEIEKDNELAYTYTAKGNLVAVISNGTAVLGLGDIGAVAGKPVMEGKGVLFKRFADIDVFDIEVDEKDIDKFCQVVKALEPTFGGVNLEDIKAPECFEIETRLKKEMKIPVFHDDQHGTAIISTAALMNASEIVKKKLGDMKVVFSGAGASAIACANMMIRAGVKLENLWLCDTKGLVYTGRKEGMNKYKDKFAKPSDWRTLSDTIKDADVFVGCSSKGALTPEMLLSMAKNPIVFALANPDPEIDYPTAKATRDDIILATGRSDYPNQVNNVLGFPFIFRGALDVRASEINEEMKLAAAKALAALAKEEVPDAVVKAYSGQKFTFGPEYIIPKPFDPRVLLWVAPAVAKAAMETGVAKQPIPDMQAYKERLEGLQGRSKDVIRSVVHRAKTNPKRVVFPESTHPLILQAVSQMVDEGICVPILLGDPAKVKAVAADHGISIEGVEIQDPATVSWRKDAEDAYLELRKRRGVTRDEASRKVLEPIYFGALMCRLGKADGLIAGLTMYYPDTIRPCLEVIGTRKGVKRVCGVYTMVLKNRVLFFSDTTMNIEPSSEELAEIALLTADLAKDRFNMEPKVAMLSFSDFGSVDHPLVRKVQKAVEIVKVQRPDLKCDGEMQADTALGDGILAESYPWVDLPGGPNVLIFPDLTSGNIGYKLVQRLAGAEVIGPITCGMAAPVHVLQRHSDLNDIIHLTALTVVEAQQK